MNATVKGTDVDVRQCLTRSGFSQGFGVVEWRDGQWKENGADHAEGVSGFAAGAEEGGEEGSENGERKGGGVHRGGAGEGRRGISRGDAEARRGKMIFRKEPI